MFLTNRHAAGDEPDSCHLCSLLHSLVIFRDGVVNKRPGFCHGNVRTFLEKSKTNIELITCQLTGKEET